MRPVLLAALVVAGCARDAVAVEAPLSSGLEVVAQRGGTTLLFGAPSTPRPQTDERPSWEIFVDEGDGPISLGRGLGAALVRGGAVWVTPELGLVGPEGDVLDQGVLPELAVSDDGDTIAYPHVTSAGGGVFVLALRDGQPVLATDGLAVADRPLFAEQRLVVVGARASGIAGIWLADPTGLASPLAVTNASLRTGHPFGDAFVPPPAFHRSMRVEAGVLVYDDGRTERRVELP